MACWALSGASGLGGISCWDQLQWHVQLTEKRIGEAKALLSEHSSEAKTSHTLDPVFSYLTQARKLALGKTRQAVADASPASQFDSVYVTYNQACGALIEVNAKALEAVRPGSAEGRRAARRYRLFSAAAEQLGRERAFVCGHGEQDWSPTSPEPGRRSLHRLAEILGARKILLGTVVEGLSGDIATTSTGLLGTLIGEDEPSLLTPGDIAKLESLEQRIIEPQPSNAVPSEEWYLTITQLLNEIHSRIAMTLVGDMRLQDVEHTRQARTTARGTPARDMPEREGSNGRRVRLGCHCRAGLKACLLVLVERL